MFGSYEKLLDVPQLSASEHSCPFPGFPRAASPSAGRTLSHTQSREHSKMPPTPSFQSLPFPGDKEAKPEPQSLHTEAPREDTLRNQQTTALGPKSLLRLPRMGHRDLNPAEAGSCCSPSRPLQTLLDPGSRRAQEGTGGHRDPTDSNPEAGAEQLFVTLGCSMEVLPAPDCCSGRLAREHEKGFKVIMLPL